MRRLLALGASDVSLPRRQRNGGEPPPQRHQGRTTLKTSRPSATKVQPLFLAKREGLMTCMTCHNGKVGTRLQLDPLPEGATTWSEEAAAEELHSRRRRWSCPGLRRPAGCCCIRSTARPAATVSTPGANTGTPRATPSGGRSPNGSAVRRAARTSSCNRTPRKNNIHVIDADTNNIVGVIEDIEVPHGLVILPGGARMYLTNEARRTLDVVDSRTFKVAHRVPLGGLPNNVDVSQDGRWAYVGIRQEPGAVDASTPSRSTTRKPSR